MSSATLLAASPPVFLKILDARVRFVNQGGWSKERKSKSWRNPARKGLGHSFGLHGLSWKKGAAFLIYRSLGQRPDCSASGLLQAALRQQYSQAA